MLKNSLILSALIMVALQHAARADADWPVNGGPYNIRHSILTQVNTDNVAQLQVAWSFDSHDSFKVSEMQSNPIVFDGTLYATVPTMHVIALDAATGRQIWKFDPSDGASLQRRFRQRGMTVLFDIPRDDEKLSCAKRHTTIAKVHLHFWPDHEETLVGICMPVRDEVSEELGVWQSSRCCQRAVPRE